MLLALGIIVIVIGALVSLVSVRYSFSHPSLEHWGGGCFIVGTIAIVIHFPMP